MIAGYFHANRNLTQIGLLISYEISLFSLENKGAIELMICFLSGAKMQLNYL